MDYLQDLFILLLVCSVPHRVLPAAVVAWPTALMTDTSPLAPLVDASTDSCYPLDPATDPAPYFIGADDATSEISITLSNVTGCGEDISAPMVMSYISAIADPEMQLIRCQHEASTDLGGGNYTCTYGCPSVDPRHGSAQGIGVRVKTLQQLNPYSHICSLY